MAQQLPFFEWLKKMAVALDMDYVQFKEMPSHDRAKLIAKASGMTYEAFKQLGADKGWEAQVAAIKAGPDEVKTVTEPTSPVSKIPAVDRPVVEPDPVKAKPAAPDVGAALGALGTLLEPVVAGLVEQRLEEALKALKADIGDVTRTVTVKVGSKEPVKIDGHVHPAFDKVVKLAASGLSIMLTGPAGTGKTTLAAKVAEALGRPFGSVSCTAGMSEGELIGKLLPNETGGFAYRTSQFVTLYESGGVFLVDEMDAADPNVLLKVNSSIGSVRGGGRWFNDLRSDNPEVKQHKDFVLIAATNTFGTGAGSQYVGRNQLDAATLNRFRIVEIDYDRTYEQKVGDSRIVDWLWGVRERVQSAKLRRVVSTRDIERCTMELEAGFPFAEIKADFFASWTKDEMAKVSWTKDEMAKVGA